MIAIPPFLLGAEDVDPFVGVQKKQNTEAATARDISMWENRSETKALEHIVSVLLDVYMAEIFICIRKLGGTDYELITLVSNRNSVNTCLKDKGSSHSLRDRVFTKPSRH